MTVKNRREFHLSDFAAGDAPGFTRMLPNLLAARFAQVALGQIRCVVIGQRLSSSSRRAESTDNSGRRSNPRTSLRSAKSTPAPSSAGKRRAAGRPRSRTSRPCFPRAAARTHWPVFMCKSRIVIVVICAQCVTKDRLSTPPRLKTATSSSSASTGSQCSVAGLSARVRIPGGVRFVPTTGGEDAAATITTRHPSQVKPTSFYFSTIDRVVGLGLCPGAIFTAFRLDRPCRIPEKVRGRPGGPTLPRGRRTKSKGDGPLV